MNLHQLQLSLHQHQLKLKSYLVGKGAAPLGDNTLASRLEFVDILRGQNIADMHRGNGITLTISENGDVYGWKNTAINNFNVNPWGFPSANFSDPFQPKSFSSAFFTDGLTYKPSKAKIDNVDKFLATQPQIYSFTKI